jgi:hypothetical protein
MGRSKLSTLKETTLKTFFEMVNEFGISNQFEYKKQDKCILWKNGSEIVLKDLFFYPSDPEFSDLGSLEITGAFIDECDQIIKKAWQVVKSRIRYKLSEFKLIPKMLGTCNPSQRWVYTTFYTPYKNGEMPDMRRFIQALPTDNPHLPDSYLEALLELDNASKQRLYYGNWEWDDSKDKLCDYDAICDMFTNEHVPKGFRYISADLAMKGRDRFVAGFWEGFQCNIAIDMKVSTAKQIEMKLKELKISNSVGNSRIVADSDGLGAYLEAYIRNIKTFHGGASPKNKKEFFNLKAECGFKLAEKINKREIKINCSPEQEEEIKRELSMAFRSDDTNLDNKKKLLPKVKMKELLGNSPDYLDMLLMRMFFEVKKGGGIW